ncbi:MAG: hypothetical protein H6621_01370 [Halobacteriovoraceae bacterium]|nr:hypothetical protein [Halobacteriovoraceae bacterium]
MSSFEGVRNLLELKDQNSNNENKFSRSHILYNVHNYKNLKDICSRITKKIQVETPVVAFYYKGRSLKWLSTLWSIASYFEFENNKKVCLIQDIDEVRKFFPHYQENKSVVLVGKNQTISHFHLTNNISVIDVNELRDRLQELGDLQEFEIYFNKILSSFQMFFLGMNIDLEANEKDDFWRFLLLQCTGVIYVFKLKEATFTFVNKVRRIFKKFNLVEFGAIIEQSSS